MSMTPESELAKRLEQAGLIAVLVIDREEDAVPVAKALMEGGVKVMELTLRTPVALDALRRIRAEVPEMLSGIGTVLTIGQLDEVVKAEADFAMAPGVNTGVIRHAQAHRIAFAPGIMTPTDIDQSVDHGCQVLKYFPASTAGGLKHLRTIAAPFQHLGLGFIPLGGINADNMGEYLAEPLITAVGGSWLAPRELIREQKWDEITRRAEEATRRVAEIRG